VQLRVRHRMRAEFDSISLAAHGSLPRQDILIHQLLSDVPGGDKYGCCITEPLQYRIRISSKIPVAVVEGDDKRLSVLLIRS